jgi:hypothetical protein
MKKPTLREQVALFHHIMDWANMACMGCDNGHFKKIVHAMDDWSYAHRVGNGELTERQQQNCINRAYRRLEEVVNGKEH